ncbi:MAG: Carbohydrate kinase family protein [Thermodesulfobacteriota bacterium]|nr:Carbohydrate kinase family protein [Thermodesulfobacteriota bacterium]
MNTAPAHVVGFGSLNLDEFWEVPPQFLRNHRIRVGHEYVRDVEWFRTFYPSLNETGVFRGADPGGSAANMIAALRQMGFHTGFIGATGQTDAHLLRLQELGPPSNLRIIQSNVPAGRCLSLICSEDSDKDRALVILPNANDLAGSIELEPDFIPGFQWMHMTSFVSGNPLEKQVKLVMNFAGRIRISFDPGPLYCGLGIQTLKHILQRTEILFVSEEELLTLTQRHSVEPGVEDLLELGTKLIVVKKGPRGITAFSLGSSSHRPAHKPERIVDRTGAGDVGAAGFLAGQIMGLPLEECLELAVMAAAKSLGGYGRRAYPDTSFLRTFWEKK